VKFRQADGNAPGFPRTGPTQHNESVENAYRVVPVFGEADAISLGLKIEPTEPQVPPRTSILPPGVSVSAGPTVAMSAVVLPPSDSSSAAQTVVLVAAPSEPTVTAEVTV
jgi:hypothetical protein